MNPSVLDWLLFATTTLGSVVLLAVLIFRCRWKHFPVFTAFVSFEIVQTLVLYLFFQYGSYGLYRKAYWTSILIEFVFELGIIIEIARIVLRPTGTWVRDARKQFILWGTLGILIAAALPFMVTPPAATFLQRLEVRGDLFTSLVICELIAVVTRTSLSLGLGWRSHVMALGNGWTAWAVVAILVDGLHSYFGASLHFRDLEHVRMLAYLTTIAYWTVHFWVEEPVRQSISPDLQAYIEALHLRIIGDLGTIETQR